MSRRSEIRRLEQLVVAVRGGQSRSLVVVGPAGIGKSWLCRQASVLAEGFTVVRTRGVESEAHLGYGGLFDVLSPLLDGRVDRLLAPRRDALRGALRIAEAPVVDPFAVAVATLDLLAMAAEDAPVLVVVDDAPWVDAASLEALRFAARRLDADRVGFLFAARSELAAPFARRVESLPVGGLDTAEAVGLVNEFARSRVAASVARTLAEAGRGDPLWLREAARELSPDQMSGAAPLTDRFRAPASVREGFERLALSLPAAARQALALLAADEQAPPPVMQRALSDLGIDESAIQAGIDCGLAHVEAGRPRFSHPLALAAALAVADPAQRRLAHEALARAWDDAGEPERATWHLAEAGDGPDAHVSSALAGVARAARARGAPGAAADGVAAGDRDGARRGSGAAAAAGAGSRSRAGGAGVRGAGRARRDPRPRTRRGAARGRRDPAGSAADLAGPLRAGRSGPGGGRRADRRSRSGARGADAVRGGVRKRSHGDVPAAVATAEAAVALAGPLGGSSAAAAESTLGLILDHRG